MARGDAVPTFPKAGFKAYDEAVDAFNETVEAKRTITKAMGACRGDIEAGRAAAKQATAEALRRNPRCNTSEDPDVIAAHKSVADAELLLAQLKTQLEGYDWAIDTAAEKVDLVLSTTRSANVENQVKRVQKDQETYRKAWRALVVARESLGESTSMLRWLSGADAYAKRSVVVPGVVLQGNFRPGYALSLEFSQAMPTEWDRVAGVLGPDAERDFVAEIVAAREAEPTQLSEVELAELERNRQEEYEASQKPGWSQKIRMEPMPDPKKHAALRDQLAGVGVEHDMSVIHKGDYDA